MDFERMDPIEGADDPERIVLTLKSIAALLAEDAGELSGFPAEAGQSRATPAARFGWTTYCQNCAANTPRGEAEELPLVSPEQGHTLLKGVPSKGRQLLSRIFRG